MSIPAERLASVAAELGEGVTWHADRDEVIWVDILRGEVHACDLEGRDRVVQRHADPVGAIALSGGGEIIAFTAAGLCRSTGEVLAGMPEAGPELRTNDGKPDPVGRFVGGTMTIGDARPHAGSLWSLDGGSTATRLVDRATIPNGLAWSKAGDRLFWIDTPTRRIDVFDYDLDSGVIGNRRTHVQFDETGGDPDGMCIDEHDGLWVACWGAGEVRRYHEGRCDEVVVLPTPFATCPTFVGDQLDQLVISTASIEFDECPDGAGDLYIAEVGVTGMLPHRLGAWAS